MRDIKFRGKRVDNGEWVYGYYAEITVPSLGLMIRTDSDETFAEDTKPYIIEVKVRQHPYFSNAEPYCIVENEYYEVIPETVGQYTGLKDKTGKAIYEGDIVELTNTYKGMNTKSIVEIDFIDFTFAGKWAEEYSPSGYMYNPLGSYNFPIVTIEVIGNIYENPELLKE